MRLIDVDAIPWSVDGVGDIPVITKQEIEEMPVIDAVPVRHGKWVDEGYYADYRNERAYRCSECGWHMITFPDELFRYCPMCGARMRREE